MGTTQTQTRQLVEYAGGAEYLGISQRHLHRLVEQRRIAHIKVGNRVLFRVADLDAFLDAHRVPANAEVSE